MKLTADILCECLIFVFKKYKKMLFFGLNIIIQEKKYMNNSTKLLLLILISLFLLLASFISTRIMYTDQPNNTITPIYNKCYPKLLFRYTPDKQQHFQDLNKEDCYIKALGICVDDQRTTMKTKKAAFLEACTNDRGEETEFCEYAWSSFCKTDSQDYCRRYMLDTCEPNPNI
ncbi:hypothetical protein CDIK_0914 [Cucumispora dikerogammari]|nr:hypothetical protein CDIK_0914 [Cucumispora dikerogammari]